jgi:putative DNA primase/helicase
LADTPKVVADETADYRQEQDVIGEFLAETTKQSPYSEVSANDLYSRYADWAKASGFRPASKVSLGRRLGERGLTRRKTSGAVFWMGIELKTNTGFGGGYAR